MGKNIPLESWDAPPQIGDEIAALGENGQLVGKTFFTGGFSAMTIYGDDYYTPNTIENLADGEKFTIEVWSATKNNKKQYKFEKWQQGNRFYESKQIAIVGIEDSDEKIVQEELLVEVFPNPNQGSLNIALKSDNSLNATVSIVDIIGKVVYVNELEIKKGKQIHTLNLSSLTVGSYSLLITSDKVIAQKNIVRCK